MLSGTLPFLGTKDRLYEGVCAGRLLLAGSRWNHISDHAKDLIRQMLTVDPEERITVAEALNHLWICDRERFAPKNHLHETVGELRKFNARRKLKGAVLAAVSSPKWTQFYDSNESNGRTGGNNAAANNNNGNNNNGNNVAPSISGSSTAASDFGGGGDDEVTAAAVGLILDSLDDIHCLLESRRLRPSNLEGDDDDDDCDDDEEDPFLYSVLCDQQLHQLLNLYDQINTNSYRPFRYPPSDACVKYKEAMATLKLMEVTATEGLGDIEELRRVLAHHHMRALLQTHDVVAQEVYGEDAIRVTPPPSNSALPSSFLEIDGSGFSGANNGEAKVNQAVAPPPLPPPPPHQTGSIVPFASTSSSSSHPTTSPYGNLYPSIDVSTPLPPAHSQQVNITYETKPGLLSNIHTIVV